MANRGNSVRFRFWHHGRANGPIVISVVGATGEHVTQIIQSPTRVLLDKTDRGANAALERSSQPTVQRRCCVQINRGGLFKACGCVMQHKRKTIVLN